MAGRGAHRHDDRRACSAKTTVQNQSSVLVNNKLWAVKGTFNDHGTGALIDTTGHTVFVENKPVIVHGPDHAHPDNKKTDKHHDPYTAQGSDDVFAYK